MGFEAPLKRFLLESLDALCLPLIAVRGRVEP